MTDYSELLNRGIINSTKIYIGNLPVSMNEMILREIFEKFCPVSEVTIKKGNAQGHFDKFCYGFVMMNLPEKDAIDIMNQINKEHPNWKLKIKEEAPEHQRPEKFQRPQNYPPQNFQHQNMYPIQQNMPPPPMMQNSLPPPPPPHQMHQGYQSHQHQGQHGLQDARHQGHQDTRHQGHQGQQGHQNHQYHQPMQPYQGYPRYNMNPGNFAQQQPQNDKGQIYGQKKNKIMVRQLWMGGIPEMMEHKYMSEVMSQFGPVQATQIFPKFAFVKYKKAVDAAIAYQRASKIYDTFGQNSGFRISFSDPSRRKQIVGNHYEFEKTAVLLPVLFLGFPPITSANVEINHMMSICDKFGPITNYYLKKSTNAQMRSYILFTYDSLKNALRAKQQLCRRKDLLGEKRVQITLLLDQQSVLKGRDFSNTQRNFINNQQGQQRPKRMPKPGYPDGYGAGYQPPLVPGNYHNPVVPPNPAITPPFGYPYHQQQAGYSGMNQYNYYPPQQSSTSQNQSKNIDKQNEDVLDFLHSVYDDGADQKKKGPQKKQNDKQQNTKDIIRQMLGKSAAQKKKPEQEQNQGQIHDNDHSRQKQPNWSGFITWRTTRRTGVDGFAIGELEFADYNINVTSLIINEEVLLKDKANMMVLEPTNSISEPIFNQYVKIFSKRTGICMTKNWLVYLIGKNELSQSLHPIKDKELLVVMEKPNISSQLKDKVMQCDDSYFE